jgi:hypothetical protein
MSAGCCSNPSDLTIIDIITVVPPTRDTSP